MENILRIQSMRLELESNRLTASTESIKSIVPSFLNGVKNFFNSLEFTKADMIQGVNPGGLYKKLEKSNYVELSNIELIGPRGLTISFLDYLSILDEAVGVCSTLKSDFLIPFDRWLGVKINDPESLNSASSVGVKDDPEKIFTPNKDKLKKAIDNHQVSNRYKYSKALQRNSDWVKIIEQTNDISRKYIQTDPESILKMVKKIAVNLDTLANQLDKNDLEYNIAGETVSNLGKYVYKLGLFVEYYSMVGLLVKTMAVAMDENVDKLNKMLK